MAQNIKSKDYNVIIDPMTRIEGHLRIQATAVPAGPVGPADKDKVGSDKRYLINKPALSSSTMVRGFEIIMKNRDPREAWAFAQRICGVCTVVHGLTSVRAVEAAVGIKVTRNADYIRNLMIGAQYVHDHVMHFYHLHALDWVDVVSALGADTKPNTKKTVKVARDWAKAYGSSYYSTFDDTALNNHFDDVKTKLADLKTRGQLGLFSNGYWGHPAYLLSPEQNLLLVSHYLEALAWAPDAVLIHAVCGGKDPHPDLLVGGMQYPFSSGDFRDPCKPEDPFYDPSNASKPKWQVIMEGSIQKMQYFVNNVYLPDVRLAASVYKDWANYGGTFGNFLCFGDFPTPGLVTKEFTEGAIDFKEGYIIPQGVIWKNKIKEVADFYEDKVTENVTHAWYDQSDVDLHPYKGETKLSYKGKNGAAGPMPDQDDYMLDENDKYSWMKSPRYDGQPMEVGPLAHVLMMYAKAKDNPKTDAEKAHKKAKDLVDAIWIKELKLPYQKLNSTLGRIFCRALETKIIGDKLTDWLLGNEDETDPTKPNQDIGLVPNKDGPYYNPNTEDAVLAMGTQGFGYTEAPRGALGHWVKIRTEKSTDPNGKEITLAKIDNYQCIVASLWNAGPRDANDVPGPYEQSLQGHHLYDPQKPLEVLRTIHSFDPCIGCAVHIVDPNGEPLVKVDVRHY